MNTARGALWRVRWRHSSNQHTCALPNCNRLIGPSYLGLGVCWEHFNQHVDESSRFNLSRYAEGENSKLVLNPGVFGGFVLEMVDEEGLVDTIRQGDRVAWHQLGKTRYGTVDSIVGTEAETVNRTKKSCAISDAVIVWVLWGSKKLALSPAEIVALQESDEEETDDAVDELMALMGE